MHPENVEEEDHSFCNSMKSVAETRVQMKANAAGVEAVRCLPDTSRVFLEKPILVERVLSTAHLVRWPFR
jgi:hypothetical protein